MERVVESVRAACPNKAYGCEATPPYHTIEQHILACPHAPRHCPGGEGCGFVGSAAALVDHAAAAHGSWPIHRPYHSRQRPFSVPLRDGLNFVVSDDDLLLLNVTRFPYCHAVSVVYIRPRAAAEKALELTIELVRPFIFSHHWVVSHEQKTVFKVACSDLADGLSNSNCCCHQLIVPNYVYRVNIDALEVSVGISTNGTSFSQSSMSESSDMGFSGYPSDEDVWC